MSVNSVATTLDRYIAVWNENDDESRRALVAQTFTEDARFTDPLVAVTGADAINNTISGIQSQMAGLTFRRGETVDAHHNIARFTWELAPDADAEAIAIGFDVAEFADDGRINTIYGFIDKMPG